MFIGNTDAAAFAEGFAVAARIRELTDRGDMNDPAVAAEIAQLRGLVCPIVARAMESAREALARVGTTPRKTLELMGITREEVKRLADACLAIYEDKPETQA